MKILLGLLLISLSLSSFADRARTRQNWDGSTTTTYSDGTSSTTRQNWDNSTTTRFSDGSTARSHENWDGSIITEY